MPIDRISPTLRPEGPVVMRQDWLRLLFLHWTVDPGALQVLLPPGLTLDTFDGKAYVGLVPFTMRNVRPVGVPPVRGVSHFHECNVRTYVHKDGQDPGVWFFSLDAANPLAVATARALWRLPYFFARMSLTDRGNETVYATERITPGPTRAQTGGPVGCHVRYTPTGTPNPATPGTLEHFLAERYILYSFAAGNLFSGRVHHRPYPLQTAAVHELTETLIPAAGIIPTPTGSPLAHYASGVSVEVFPLMGVGR